MYRGYTGQVAYDVFADTVLANLSEGRGAQDKIAVSAERGAAKCVKSSGGSEMESQPTLASSLYTPYRRSTIYPLYHGIQKANCLPKLRASGDRAISSSKIENSRFQSGKLQGSKRQLHYTLRSFVLFNF